MPAAHLNIVDKPFGILTWTPPITAMDDKFTTHYQTVEKLVAMVPSVIKQYEWKVLMPSLFTSQEA